jgi:hypothetical protein
MGGFKITGTGAGTAALSCALGGQIIVDALMDFAAIPLAHINAQDTGSMIQLTSNYTISGNSAAHLQTNYGGEIQYGASVAVTVTGTPAFSTAFANAAVASTINAFLATYSGVATGNYYNVASNAVINTQGGGPTFFPGSITGTSSTGGQYV